MGYMGKAELKFDKPIIRTNVVITYQDNNPLVVISCGIVTAHEKLGNDLVFELYTVFCDVLKWKDFCFNEFLDKLQRTYNCKHNVTKLGESTSELRHRLIIKELDFSERPNIAGFDMYKSDTKTIGDYWNKLLFINLKEHSEFCMNLKDTINGTLGYKLPAWKIQEEVLSTSFNIDSYYTRLKRLTLEYMKRQITENGLLSHIQLTSFKYNDPCIGQTREVKWGLSDNNYVFNYRCLKIRTDPIKIDEHIMQHDWYITEFLRYREDVFDKPNVKFVTYKPIQLEYLYKYFLACYLQNDDVRNALEQDVTLLVKHADEYKDLVYFLDDKFSIKVHLSHDVIYKAKTEWVEFTYAMLQNFRQNKGHFVIDIVPDVATELQLRYTKYCLMRPNSKVENIDYKMDKNGKILDIELIYP